MDNSNDGYTLAPLPTRVVNSSFSPLIGAEVALGGTIVSQVDADGNQVGPEYYSMGWSNRNRPSCQSYGSKQWIDEIVVSETRKGAIAGVNNNNLAVNLPLKEINKDVASSSPWSSDVLVRLVNSDGEELKRFTMAYVTVVDTEPSKDKPDEVVAKKMLVSNSEIKAQPDFTVGPDGKPIHTKSATGDG